MQGSEPNEDLALQKLVGRARPSSMTEIRSLCNSSNVPARACVGLRLNGEVLSHARHQERLTVSAPLISGAVRFAF